MATFGFETIKPQLHIIPNSVPRPLVDVIHKLAPNLTRKTWLVGGTALSAYYFGHRRSDVLDLFAADTQSFTNTVNAVRALVKDGVTLADESRTPLYYRASATYKGHAFTIDVVLDELIHSVGHATETGDGLWVPDLDTLFAMKASTLVSRASEKDLFDLDHLLHLLKSWNVELIMNAGQLIDGGLDVETLLISLKGARLRQEACAFLLPDSKITVAQAFHKIIALRDRLVLLLLVAAKQRSNDELVHSIKTAIKELKK